MSDLLNKASLVVIPSGYKEDTVYSVVPSDGSGDLSFTRASNGTRVNSAGLVEVVAWNLAEYSEDFAQAAPIWNKYQATITSNTTTAPNGTLTADTITDNSTNDVHIAYQDRAGIVAGTYTISVYAKASTLSHINLQWFDGTTFYTSNAFNLSNGTTTGANQSIENVGNGWYRCIFTITTTVSGTQYPYVMTNNGTSNVYVGTGQSVFIWGYQVNIGSTAKPYFPTTDRLNVPRLTYQNGGGGCPSLLLEKQSTNLITYSEQFDNAAWSKIDNGAATTPVVTANYTTSPDGTQNADRVQFARTGTADSVYSLLISNTCNTSATSTYTMYVKSLTSSTQNVLVYWGGGTGQVFQVTTEWTRITLSNLPSASQQMVIGTRGGTGNYYNGGDLSIDIAVWGAQLEQSSYPTSYIPTTSSSATRVADVVQKTGISSLIGQTEGVIYWEGIIPVRNESGISSNSTSILNSARNVNVNSGFSIQYIESTSSINALLFVGDGTYTPKISLAASSITIGTHVKVAFAYKSGDSALYVNGNLSQSSNTTFTSSTSISELWFNDLNVYFGYPSSGTIKEAILFPTRLTNAELASLTTI